MVISADFDADDVHKSPGFVLRWRCLSLEGPVSTADSTEDHGTSGQLKTQDESPPPLSQISLCGPLGVAWPVTVHTTDSQEPNKTTSDDANLHTEHRVLGTTLCVWYHGTLHRAHLRTSRRADGQVETAVLSGTPSRVSDSPIPHRSTRALMSQR